MMTRRNLFGLVFGGIVATRCGSDSCQNAAVEQMCREFEKAIQAANRLTARMARMRANEIRVQLKPYETSVTPDQMNAIRRSLAAQAKS